MHQVEDSSSVAPWVPNLLDQVSGNLEAASSREILRWTFDTFGDGVCIGTAFGQSGMALIDMALEIKPDVDIFYIDTGLFFPETYDLIARAEAHYGRSFRRVTPALTLDEQAQAHGPALWKTNSDRCCAVRKVVPLREALQGRSAWLTALRRDQSETRRNAPVVSWNERRQVVKVAPLVNMTERDVWKHVVERAVPYNELHDKGYPSIGCAPCTSAVRPGDDIRAGRWAGSAKTECGLHL